MIDGNRLKFGYGDIAVAGCRFNQQIRFWQFKPPTNCGDNLNDSDVEFIGDPLYLQIKDLDEYSEFISLLDNLTCGNCIFEFKGLVFDFTKYNTKSIQVCKTKADYAISMYCMALAC